MPIYEYECRECGYRFDALQKMSDPLLTDCPACGQPSLKKRLSAPHFRLKGSGWYETDFKNSGRPKADDSGAAGQSKSTGGNGKEAAKKPGKKDAAGSSGGDSSAKSAASGASADSG